MIEEEGKKRAELDSLRRNLKEVEENRKKSLQKKKEKQSEELKKQQPSKIKGINKMTGKKKLNNTEKSDLSADKSSDNERIA